MEEHKTRRMIIQVAIILAFIFGIIIAYLTFLSAQFELGIMFLSTLQVIVMLAILYVMEQMFEQMEMR